MKLALEKIAENIRREVDMYKEMIKSAIDEKESDTHYMNGCREIWGFEHIGLITYDEADAFITELASACPLFL